MPEFEDFADPKIAVAALVAAAVVSKPGRRLLRRGAVYGTAGVLMARDTVSGLGSGVFRGFRDATSRAAGSVRGIASSTLGATSER
jgi:hypothetical protein